MVTNLEYEVSYEWDDYSDYGFTGSILAFNVFGHGHPPEDIDWFLLSMCYYEELIEKDEGDWEVRETYLRKVPHPDGGSLHVYGPKGRGAKAVTVIEKKQGWDFWCINHPYEPAQTGFPCSRVVDGEATVQHRLLEFAEKEDPRRDVAAGHGGGEGYIYMCRECSTSFNERLYAARKEALQKEAETDGV